MLVAQRDFQVVDRLAVALEAEMARLDDAGVDRADGHLVDLVAGHLEEIGHAAGRRLPVVGGKRTGFSQGWPTGRTSHCSKISRSNSGPAGSRASARDTAGPRRPRRPPDRLRRPGPARRTAATLPTCPDRRTTPRAVPPAATPSMTAWRNCSIGSTRAIGQRKGVAVVDDKRAGGGHQLAPNAAAAWCSRSVSCGGT